MYRRSSSRPRSKPLRPLTLEHLESRELMAGQVFADRVQLVPDSSHAGQYVLAVQGTDKNDKIVLTQKNDNLTVRFNGKSAGVYSAQSLSGVMVDGGLGNDTISLPAKSTIPSVLLGGTGNDKLTGGGGSNLLVGGDGNDKLTGGRGTNVLMGGEGKDVLTGGAGDDQLFGDGDNDKLNGKGGRNTLLGGAGADKLAGKKTTNLLAEGNINATDRAFEDWDVVNRFTEFLDENMSFILSLVPSEVSGKWEPASDGLRNSFSLDDGRGSVAASVMMEDFPSPFPQDTGLEHFCEIGLANDGSLTFRTPGEAMQISISDRLSSHLQDYVEYHFLPPPSPLPDDLPDQTSYFLDVVYGSLEFKLDTATTGHILDSAGNRWHFHHVQIIRDPNWIFANADGTWFSTDMAILPPRGLQFIGSLTFEGESRFDPLDQRELGREVRRFHIYGATS